MDPGDVRYDHGRLAAVVMVLKEWLVGMMEVKAVVGKLRGGWEEFSA
jgi:hypothetical protein